jgi:hypothetical protein
MRGVVRLPGAPEAWPFGGPRGGWSTGCGAHQRGWAQVAQGASHPSRTSVVCGWRRAPWVRGAVAQAARPTPTEQRTGADRAKGSVVACGHPPWRGGSPLALGGCCAALVPGVAQSTRRPGPTASGPALRLPLGRAATPTRATPGLRRGRRRRACDPRAAPGSRARWGVPRTSPYAWWAVVVVLGPGRGLAGASRRLTRALTRTPVAGVVSPCAGARAWQGRVAPPPARWVWRWVVPPRARGGLGQAARVRVPSVSSPWRAKPAPGGIARRVAGPGGAPPSPSRCPSRCQPPSPKAPPDVDGSCGPGGAPWGGGGGSLGGPSPPIGCQPPNKGLQPTPGSAVRVWQALPCTAPRCG